MLDLVQLIGRSMTRLAAPFAGALLLLLLLVAAWVVPKRLQARCAGAELHGWVTGALKITNVELFLDNGSLGSANITGPPRIDVPSTTPVTPWKIAVNLDQTPKGLHVIRAVGTDVNGNRRQFASVSVQFAGPGSNCVVRRRVAGGSH